MIIYSHKYRINNEAPALMYTFKTPILSPQLSYCDIVPTCTVQAGARTENSTNGSQVLNALSRTRTATKLSSRGPNQLPPFLRLAQFTYYFLDRNEGKFIAKKREFNITPPRPGNQPVASKCERRYRIAIRSKNFK